MAIRQDRRPLLAIRRALLPCLLLLAGCNLFNPLGEANGRDLSDNAKILEAEKHLRDGANSKAAKLYAEVLKHDSTKSKAYFGLAKAELRAHDVNHDVVLRLVQTFSDDADSSATQMLKAMRFMRRLSGEQKTGIRVSRDALGALIRRDTLGLTDGIVGRHRVFVDHQILNAAVVFDLMTQLGDDTSSCVPIVDPTCLFDSPVIAAAVSDPQIAGTVNVAMDELSDGLRQVLALSSDMLNADTNGVIGGEYAGHSASVEKSAIQESIEEVSVKVDYFRLPDGKDNDGDGRVDEEKLNGSDDDGDGLIDEDLGV